MGMGVSFQKADPTARMLDSWGGQAGGALSGETVTDWVVTVLRGGSPPALTTGSAYFIPMNVAF